MKTDTQNRVQRCADGKSSWIYALDMVSNPTIFLTVFKIFFYIILAGWLVFGFFFHLVHGEFREFLAMGKVLLLAAVYGGKYVVPISNKRHFKP